MATNHHVGGSTPSQGANRAVMLRQSKIEHRHGADASSRVSLVPIALLRAAPSLCFVARE